MTNAQAHAFAAEWIDNFNRLDLEAVLACFAEDAEFTSPRATAVAGKPALRSRQELGDYWRKSVSAIRSLQFTLDHVINDENANRVVIVYISEVDGKRIRAAEFFEFNDAQQVIRGEAMHGVAV
jgi:ketosteroid isomerase-like protein